MRVNKIRFFDFNAVNNIFLIGFFSVLLFLRPKSILFKTYFINLSGESDFIGAFSSTIFL